MPWLSEGGLEKGWEAGEPDAMEYLLQDGGEVIHHVGEGIGQ